MFGDRYVFGFPRNLTPYERNHMPKPIAQMNLLHRQILGDLLTNRTTVRTEIRGKRDSKSRKWVHHKVDVAVPTLAGHVSTENVDIAARRWTP